MASATIRRLALVAVVATAGLSATDVPAEAGTLIFTSGHSLWSVGEHGGSAKRLTTLSNAVVVAASPTGRLLLCVNPGSRAKERLYVSDLRGKHRRPFPHPGCSNGNWYIWSNDGRELVRETSEDIHLLRPDGHELRHYQPTRGPSGGASFSPNGQSLVFTSGNDLYAVGRNGGEAHRITSTPSTSNVVEARPGDPTSFGCVPGAQDEFFPLWAQAGIVTVVQRCGDGPAGLVTGVAFLDSDGGLVRDLLPTGPGMWAEMRVRLSPDGRQVAIFEKEEVLIIDLSTGARRTISLPGASDVLAWAR